MTEEIRAFRSSYNKFRTELMQQPEFNMLKQELMYFNLQLPKLIRSSFPQLTFEPDDAFSWLQQVVFPSFKRIVRFHEQNLIRKTLLQSALLFCIKTNNQLNDQELLQQIEEQDLITKEQKSIKHLCNIFNLDYQLYQNYSYDELKSLCQATDPAQELFENVSPTQSNVCKYCHSKLSSNCITKGKTEEHNIEPNDVELIEPKREDEQDKKRKFREYQRKRNMCLNYGIQFDLVKDQSEEELRALVDEIKRRRLNDKQSKTETLRVSMNSKRETLKQQFKDLVQSREFESVLTNNIEPMIYQRPMSFIEKLLQERKDRELLLLHHLKDSSIEGYLTLPCAQDFILHGKYSIADIVNMIKQIAYIQVQLQKSE